MKKRNLLAVLALSVITCGIYMIYWMYAVRKELVAQTGNPKDIPPVWYIFAPFLLLIALFVVLLAAGSSSGSDNIPAAIAIPVILLIASVGIACLVISVWWTWRFCLTVSRVTKGIEGQTIFWLWIILDILGFSVLAPVMVQNDINRFIDRHPKKAAVTTPPAA